MMHEKQVFSIGIAILTVVSASTLALGVPISGDASSASDVQETTTTMTTTQTVTATTTVGVAETTTVGVNATTTVGARAERLSDLFVENLSLRNVTARNVTIRRLLLPTGENLTNVTLPEVMVTATFRDVTLLNVTLRNETLAQRITPAGDEMERLRLSNETIDGVVIENATLFNSNFVTVTRQPQAQVQNETAGPPAVEIGRAFAAEATIFELVVVEAGAEANVTTTEQLGTTTIAGTTPAETTNETAEATTTTP